MFCTSTTKKESENEKCVCIIFISMDGILWTLIFPYCVDIKMWINNQQQQWQYNVNDTNNRKHIHTLREKERKHIVYLTPRFKCDDIAIKSIIIVHIEIQKWNYGKIKGEKFPKKLVQNWLGFLCTAHRLIFRHLIFRNKFFILIDDRYVRLPENYLSENYSVYTWIMCFSLCSFSFFSLSLRVVSSMQK